jgi:STE24 endopeptidase
MSPRTILVLYILFFFLELAWESLLSLLNLQNVRRSAASVPPAFVGAIEPETYGKSVAYTLTHGRFGILASLASSAILLAVVLTGSLGVLDTLARSLPIHPYLQGILFILGVSLFFWLVSLPLSLYSTFGIEARFGFNRMTPRLYALDTLKSLAVSAVIGVPVLIALFWFMDKTGRLWWIWAFCAMTAFQLVMGILYPLAIAPLFNKFTPLPEGSLRNRIVELAERLRFRTKGIFVMDGSRRSRHSNAYFTGIGKSKRIVLFDTLVNAMSEDEIVSVLAHEIGHEKKHHVRIGLAVSLVMSLAGFWVVSLLLPFFPLYQAFGFQKASYHAILVLLAFCSGPFTFFLKPLGSIWSRRHEYQADRFAVEAVGNAEGLKSALMRLTKENLANLTPHPLYSFYHYSHPTIAERLAALDRHQERILAAPKEAGAETAG